jgi:NO-binding membrane sensor protein with MHYT domain
MDHQEEGTMNQTGAPLEAFFDLRLIALSFLIAIFASYVALDFAVRIMVGRGAVRHAWLTGGAILMGVGIWSRPFVGMRAFPLAIPVRYDVPAVLLPFLVAIFASVIGLEVASGARFMRREELAGSLVMGRGIAPMRCLGMAVMRLPATSHGNLFLRGLAAVIAVIASLPVLTVPCNFHVESRWKWAKASSAAAMPAAISLLHYTGIASANFLASAVPQRASSLGPTDVLVYLKRRFAT